MKNKFSFNYIGRVVKLIERLLATASSMGLNPDILHKLYKKMSYISNEWPTHYSPPTEKNRYILNRKKKLNNLAKLYF